MLGEWTLGASVARCAACLLKNHEAFYRAVADVHTTHEPHARVSVSQPIMKYVRQGCIRDRVNNLGLRFFMILSLETGPGTPNKQIQ